MLRVRVLLLLIVTVLVSVWVLDAAPAGEKKTLEQIKKEARANTKKCTRECGDEVEAICAGEEGQKPMSFGNTCVMENYNCENNKKLKQISDGECPGGGGIRLS